MPGIQTRALNCYRKTTHRSDTLPRPQSSSESHNQPKSDPLKTQCPTVYGRLPTATPRRVLKPNRASRRLNHCPCGASRLVVKLVSTSRRAAGAGSAVASSCPAVRKTNSAHSNFFVRDTRSSPRVARGRSAAIKMPSASFHFHECVGGIRFWLNSRTGAANHSPIILARS